jgi:hypothetical protein
VGFRLHQEGYNWLVKYTQKMVEELHLRLEAPGLSADDTNLIRGDIRMCRRIEEDARRAYETGTML